MTTFQPGDVTDPRAYLADVLAKADGALRGPWWWSVGGVEANDYDGNPLMIFEREDRHVTTRNDCDFIASARTTSPAMARALIAVLDRHAPVTRVFSWRDGPSNLPRCPDCLGKAGVHECGCWGDADATYSCGECSTERDGIDWPCPTYESITAELAKEIEHG